ncbi:COMM domain-containing protein 10 [Hondaea fermentalgiana]|uniref:COMM domain-containing protein 10 n=1 Tax=Hondaea fermentalgiana TaxID=2315210 RepID=A0A2R5G112_9STRA|nr:COMM domain-containing protein 10 [Hondaea fermentalgiana]|eukprot:GBG24706.1 COMM domain-containing protein 10 [Hondaea fermentalgiana]
MAALGRAPRRFREALAAPVCAKTSATRFEALVMEIMERTGETQGDQDQDQDQDQGKVSGEGEGEGGGGNVERTGPGASGGEVLVFHAREKARLVKVTGLSRAELDDVVALAVELIKRIRALDECSAAELVSFLTSERCGMDLEHAQAFGRAWTLHASRRPVASGGIQAHPQDRSSALDDADTDDDNDDDVDNNDDLKMPKLKHVDWDVGVHLGNSNALRLAVPTATLHLHTKTRGERACFSYSFSRSELFDLFQRLEQIQQELD